MVRAGGREIRFVNSGILQDKSIVIVGGTGGLGLSAARACVAAGACVLVVGRDPARAADAAQTLGPRARAVAADAADPAVAERAVAEAAGAWGRLDALYHVAGGSGRPAGDGPLHELTDAGIETTLRHNLVSLLYSNRAAVRRFLAQGGGGSVLNLGSVLGEFPAPEHFATHAYAAAKAAVVGLTRAAAATYARHNIRFNVVAPGLVATPMSRRAQEDPKILAYVGGRQPLDGGRIGRVEDVDAAVVYFLSDQSRFVTGQVLCVDGGWSVGGS
jgi:NAD(P)-dependent dehydrogenase (short-subunit alcohol dehydrogenase family)